MNPFHSLDFKPNVTYVFKKNNIEPFEFINTLDVLKRYDNYADKYAALAQQPFLCAPDPAASDKF